MIAWHLGDPAEAQKILEPLHRDLPADFAIANLLALCLVDQDDAGPAPAGCNWPRSTPGSRRARSDAMATLGWALYRSGQARPGRAGAPQAVTGVRITPDVAYYLARVLADKGQNDDARKILQSATGLPGAFAHRKDADALLKSLPQ